MKQMMQVLGMISIWLCMGVYEGMECIIRNEWKGNNWNGIDWIESYMSPNIDLNKINNQKKHK